MERKNKFINKCLQVLNSNQSGMELKYCKKHFAMTWHKHNESLGWYCAKCKLENDFTVKEK